MTTRHCQQMFRSPAAANHARGSRGATRDLAYFAATAVGGGTGAGLVGLVAGVATGPGCLLLGMTLGWVLARLKRVDVTGLLVTGALALGGNGIHSLMCAAAALGLGLGWLTCTIHAMQRTALGDSAFVTLGPVAQPRLHPDMARQRARAVRATIGNWAPPALRPGAVIAGKITPVRVRRAA